MESNTVNPMITASQGKAPPPPFPHRRSVSDSEAFINEMKELIKPDIGDNLTLDGPDDLESRVGIDDRAKTPSRGKEQLMINPDESSPNPQNHPQNPVSDAGAAQMDPMRLKRLMANRASAKRSRVKKQERIEDLRRTIDFEQNRVSRLIPEIAYHANTIQRLRRENRELMQSMAALEFRKGYLDAEYLTLMQDREVLVKAFNLIYKKN